MRSSRAIQEEISEWKKMKKNKNKKASFEYVQVRTFPSKLFVLSPKKKSRVIISRIRLLISNRDVIKSVNRPKYTWNTQEKLPNY